MAEPKRIVVIGSGLAGARAAAGLRVHGYAGDVRVLGAERHQPYELPPLSKAVLLGESDEPDWVHEDGFYAQHKIDLRLGTAASRIELGARIVLDDNGEQHPYDRLLLATGAEPRVLPIPGAGLPGVQALRTLDDAYAVRANMRASQRVVIVGAGWIGTEAAAAARQHGAEVTVLDQATNPLQTVLGDEVARAFYQLHADHGVRWQLGSRVVEFTGDEAGVRGVQLADGSELAADTVLVAVGAAPRSEIAHAAGLEIADDGGVSVDAGLRTAAPGVYAAGDVASQFHPRYGARVRIEHWANAKNQGDHVAQNLLGAHEPYTATPYFFSDQYDLGCEYRGLADPDTDELVVRGDLPGREFIAFWLREGSVVAAMNVNMFDDGDALQALVDQVVPVSPDTLRYGDLAELTQPS